MIICKKTNWCNRCCLAVFNTGNIFLALALSKKNLLNSANISGQTFISIFVPRLSRGMSNMREARSWLRSKSRLFQCNFAMPQKLL